MKKIKIHNFFDRFSKSKSDIKESDSPETDPIMINRVKFAAYHTEIDLPIEVEYDFSDGFASCMEHILTELANYHGWKRSDKSGFANKFYEFLDGTTWSHAEFYDFMLKYATYYDLPIRRFATTDYPILERAVADGP